MNALVVYESMFGNTEQIARSIGEGLAELMDVEVHEVSAAPAQLAVGSLDLAVVGGPTHAFSLSRPATRADALRQGASHGRQEIGLREWISRLRAGAQAPVVAAFDTRVEKVRHWPGSAAHKAARMLRADGLDVMTAESFYVVGTTGPLVAGEADRARAWGRRLAEDLSATMADEPDPGVRFDEADVPEY
jgi:hypothetical protein